MQMGKKRQPHRIWNSNIHLVLPDPDKRQLGELLSGTFHEIRDRVRTVDEATVRRLTALKKEIRAIESHLGITLPAP
jgi:hypothetical protein